MADKVRLTHAIRDVSPCAGCTERFLTCQDRCPKDARGDKGIKAWKNEIERVKKAQKAYLRRCAVRWPQYHEYDGGN